MPIPADEPAGMSMLLINRFLPRYHYSVVHAGVFRARPRRASGRLVVSTCCAPAHGDDPE